MKRLRLYEERDSQIREIDFDVKRMVNAGYTGRDQESVRKHIEELKREDIPAPDSIPQVYGVISELIYLNDEIEVVGDKTSGEAEFVLLCAGRNVYVGVGSDHTDRELESVSIIKSKQVCPNLVSKQVWNLADVRRDWNEMVLRSWVKNDQGEKILYQEAQLAIIMTPEDLMVFVKNRMGVEDLDGVVIYSGTVPIIPEKIIFSDYFEAELHNPKKGKKLRCAYKINVLNYLRG